MTEEELEFQMMLRTSLFLQEMDGYRHYTMGKYFYGIDIPEDIVSTMNIGRNQFIVDMKVFKPSFEIEDIQMNGRFLMGYDGVATVTGNQIVTELIGRHQIYSLKIEGVSIEDLPNPAFDPVTGELFYPMAIGEKFRLTYKPE